MASDGVKRLVIVESGTKAQKIAPYLGSDYIVEASVGHIRDLPRGAADVPAEYKKEPWARLGVNVDKGFEPLYVVSPDKKKKVSDLKAKLKQVDELYLATDPDRPGLGREMLAWAEDYARKQGKIFLRLDSQQANHALSRYYDSLGYSPEGTCVDGSYEGILREKALDPSTET